MRNIGIIIIVLLTLGCSNEESASSIVNLDPGAASLQFPDNNQECTQGVIIFGTNQSTVTFRWSASTNTDSYELVLKNLNNQSTTSYTATSNELALDIEKGTPYSWYIISKNDDVLVTSLSAVWKFYNAGDPLESYTPFPADIVAPIMGSTITGVTTQSLSWLGSDIDNDIVNYDVYFDTTNPPTTFEVNTVSTSINVTVSANNTYYWRVVTKDSQGNNSQSEIFEFRIE